MIKKLRSGACLTEGGVLRRRFLTSRSSAAQNKELCERAANKLVGEANVLSLKRCALLDVIALISLVIVL